MAEGIKIRELDEVTSLELSDDLILDRGTSVNDAETLRVSYSDFMGDFLGRPLVFTGDVTFNGQFSANIFLPDLLDVSLGPLDDGQALVYRNGVWVNETVQSGGTTNSDLWIMPTSSAAASADNIVTLTVTVGPKVNGRYFDQGDSDCFYINGIEAPYLMLSPGRTYRFDQSDPSNLGIDHQIRFYSTIDKGFFGNALQESYFEVVGVPGNVGAYSQVTLVQDYQYDTVYYQAANRDYMGDGFANPEGDEEFGISPAELQQLQDDVTAIKSQLGL